MQKLTVPDHVLKAADKFAKHHCLYVAKIPINHADYAYYYNKMFNLFIKDWGESVQGRE
jgi:hypothetical protein